MRTKRKSLGRLVVAVVLLLAALATQGGTTNTVPWSESFESYTNGTAINGTNGWAADVASGALVTTNTAITDLLTNYPVSGRSYPLSSAAHTRVLQVSTLASNTILSASNGTVTLDAMVMPDRMTVMPVGDPTLKFALCVSTNGKLTLWHRDTGASPATNRWTELASSPEIPSNTWSRFTVLQDNSNKMFQVRVNEEAALSDPKGWSLPAGGTQPGTWFAMVQTNPAMSQLVVAGERAYVDDIVLSKMSMVWSGTNRTERAQNDGNVDNSTPIEVTLSGDTFSEPAGADLVALGKVSVAGLPAGLAAVAQVISPVLVSVTLTGPALAHEAVNSTNLVFQFGDTAFSGGNSGDVTGSRQEVGLTFLDTPVLSYSTDHFDESAVNDGSIDNSTPLVVTLDHGTFSGTVGEDIGGNAAKLVVGNRPSGLTVEALLLSSTQVRVRLLGQASAHESSNSVAALTLGFQDGAFNTVPASSVFNNGGSFTVTFADAASLIYGTTVFTETAENNGAVNGTTLTLTNKSFDAAEGEDLALSGKVASPNLPTGLTLQVVRGATAQEATLSFGGTAGAHAAMDSLVTLQVVFGDIAFVGGNAAAITGASRSNLRLQFNDPRVLAYSASGFTELSAGGIDNRTPMIITLSGDTLTGSDGNIFGADKVVAANLPAGLSAQFTRTSATTLEVRLTGTAAAHASGNSRGDIVFTFQDGAFTAGNAVYVGNYQRAGLTVTFVDDLGFFNVVPYAESFESYASGTLLPGSNGWSALYYADAAVVTNVAGLTDSLQEYSKSHASYPVSGSHTQVLHVTDSIETAIHSENNRLVYLDVMMLPVPMQADPVGDTNMQYALYVSTNGGLVVWHRPTPATAPQWQILAGAGAIDTSKWVRLTVAQDYLNNMFQIRIDEGEPVADAAGYSQPGGSHPGSWFHMVQTNGTMSTFFMYGVGDGYLDDLTVKLALPNIYGQGLGTVFSIR